MDFSAGRYVQVNRSYNPWKELAELNNLERSVRTAKQLTAENCRKVGKHSESRDIKTL